MRSRLSLRLCLLVAAAMLTVAGCTGSGSDEPVSMDEALASIQQSRREAQVPATPPPDEADPVFDEDVPKSGIYTVKVESSAGDYTIEVHRDWAPVGAERFYQLVKAGYYDECRYFRVVPGFMVQFGISGTPAVQKEWDRNIRDDAVKQSNVRGFVTFATSGPHSRTTQIFINYGDNARLDSDGFAPFGRVTEGMEHVDKINPEYRESPDQGRITNSGNTYLQQSFPNLDFVKKMSIVSETAE
jgi:peptidyl-prolyl cis-trans isomerase A (cyclophilin A)